MRSETREKPFDCVAFMREARDRISDKMTTMSRGEFHHWLRSYRYFDPVLQRRRGLGRSEGDGERRRALPLRSGPAGSVAGAACSAFGGYPGRDFRLLEPLSTVSRWSRPDEFAAVLSEAA